MTNRERFRAVCHFQKPDYVPILTCGSIDGPNPQTVRTWQQTQGFPEWVTGPEKWDEFWGNCRLHFWSPPLEIDPGPPPQVLQKSGEYVILRFANGAVRRELHDQSQRYGMPEFIEYPLKSAKDWPAYRDRWMLLGRARYPDDWKKKVETWRIRDFPLGTGMSSSFGMLRGLFGTAGACLLFHDHPEVVKDILQHARILAMERLERLMSEVELDLVLIGEDFCFRNGCFVSPKHFREFIVPHYREQVEFAKAYGVDVFWVDSDGYVEDVIDLLEEAGFNGLEAFEPRAGNDIRRVRAAHPGFIIRGGLDKFAMDCQDFAFVDREVEDKAQKLLELGGYFPGVDHGLPPTAHWRTYLHFMRRLHEFCGNPEGRFRDWL